MVGCLAGKVSIAECVYLSKLPFVVSMILTLTIASTLLFGVVYMCMDQITNLLNDELFMEGVYELREEVDVYLKKQGYTVSELQRQESEPPTLALLIEVLNITADPAGSMTHKITAPARESSEISIYEALQIFAPVISLVNDMTFTLLLCLYMLGTRVRARLAHPMPDALTRSSARPPIPILSSIATPPVPMLRRTSCHHAGPLPLPPCPSTCVALWRFPLPPGQWQLA